MDLVVEDAVFVTMAAGAEPADCMLIRDDRIAAIGRAEAVRAAAPGAAERQVTGSASAVRIESIRPGKRVSRSSLRRHI
jgi:predicted amidohydrolase YtcJ